MRQQPGQNRNRRSMRRLRLLGALTLGALSGACTGTIIDSPFGGDTGPDGTPNGGGAATGTGAGGTAGGGTAGGGTAGEYLGPGEVPMRRLNNAEYANTIRDLFGSAGTQVMFPEDGRTNGFDTLNTALPVSPLHVEAYLNAASSVISELFEADPGGIRAGWCDFQSADAADNLDCARTIVSSFAERAWRRPLDAWPDGQATSDYLTLLEPAGTLAEFPLETRLRTALEAVLTSARFIYRVELAGAGGNLDTPSLASRLSYFLWSSAPDPELLGSDLQEEAALQAQASRMQGDERFGRFLRRFSDMWLQLEKLATVVRDPEVYPDYSGELVATMAEETRGFFADYWKSPNGTVAGILLADAPRPTDPALQELYGESPRRGLITQAAIMTLTGASNRTSPVRRGMWVLERLLCAPPPPPPDGVIAKLTEELEADESLTERERLERHRVQPLCANCHMLMDPIGLGFENYDAIGAYREIDGSGKVIEPAGALPTTEAPYEAPFETPFELVALLAADERLQSCAARQLLTYGTGRPFPATDNVLIDMVRRSAGEGSATFQSLLTSVIVSEGFRRRDEVTQ